MQNDEAFVQLNILFYFGNLYEMYVFQSNPITWFTKMTQRLLIINICPLVPQPFCRFWAAWKW